MSGVHVAMSAVGDTKSLFLAFQLALALYIANCPLGKVLTKFLNLQNFWIIFKVITFVIILVYIFLTQRHR